MLNRSDLITAVLNDYAQMCADDPSDDDLSLDAYRAQLDAYTDDQLLRECGVTFDDDYTVNDYIQQHT